MDYRDKVYGETEIDEPIILDLINSKEIQRLKGIDQAGYYEPYFPGSKSSRFEHSLGVYLLLGRFGASIEEQIAGLIHDVSHSAFSHAIDYALSEGSEKKQNHQDNYFKKYVLGSAIPEILKKHNLDVDYILNENNFPLLETKLPDLCADRIDYSLRDATSYRAIGAEKIKEILENLIVRGGRWMFKDFSSARIYAQLFKKLNEKYYADLATAVMFRRVGDYLKHALKQQYIEKDDLYTTDDEVMLKINKNLENDEGLDSLWKNMNNGKGYKNNPDEYDAEVYCKSRVVDPLCQHNGKIMRISEIDPEWKDVLKKELEPKRYFIKFSD